MGPSHTALAHVTRPCLKLDASTIHYWIDASDRITRVSPNWNTFVRRNCGSETSYAKNIQGRRIWDFIHGRETRGLYELALIRVRNRDPVRLRVRCDSPSCKRWLVLEMRHTAGEVEFASHVVRQEARNTPCYLLESHMERGLDFLQLCSWCKRVELEDATWVEAEEASVKLGLTMMTRLPQLTHSICAGCLRNVLHTIGTGER